MSHFESYFSVDRSLNYPVNSPKTKLNESSLREMVLMMEKTEKKDDSSTDYDSDNIRHLVIMTHYFGLIINGEFHKKFLTRRGKI